MYELLPVDLDQVSHLRRLQAAQLHGPADPFRDAEIRSSGALCLAMSTPQGMIGYACFSPEVYDTRRLLEIYVEPGYRRCAAAFLKDVTAWVPPAYWDVSSYDRFALALAMNAGYPLTSLNAYLFAWDGVADLTLPDGMRLTAAREADVEAMQPLLMQDDFYTGDWAMLPVEVARGLWHLVTTEHGLPVAAGYVEPIPRTPWFADIGMVVSRAWRGKGLGAALARSMARVAVDLEYVPVGVCAATNKAAKAALETAGFWADGRLWSVKL